MDAHDGRACNYAKPTVMRGVYCVKSAGTDLGPACAKAKAHVGNRLDQPYHVGSAVVIISF